MELSFFSSTIVDALFPPRCVTCQDPGAWWCHACQSRVEHTLRDVAAPEGVDRLYVGGFYHDPVLRGAIHVCKFQGVTVVLPDLVQMLRARIPIPRGVAFQPCLAAPSRVRVRGFDQSVLLASHLARRTDGFTCDVLRRCRDDGIPQSTIAEHEIRRIHADRLFAIRSGVTLPKHVILVDDIVTTGATMSAAAVVLRSAGVERVDGIALALGA